MNRFPDFVRHIVQRLKLFCPSLGKVKIAQMLARVGLHLAPTTVGRILNQPSTPKPAPQKQNATRVPTADRPNHVWHVDLTTVPTSQGFWTAWLPLALPQCWPCCWWVAVAIDHYSRRVMGVAAFRQQPTSEMVRAFLGRAIRQAGTAPKHLICDKGPQFWCEGFKRWCERRGIRPRFGAVGKQGSIAVVERFIKTLKEEGTRRLLVPLLHKTFRAELSLFTEWYNGHRPHTWLGGSTPDEVYDALPPANERPRIEPRARWPARSACAQPRAPVDGKPGTVVELDVTHVAGRKHLPIVTLRRVA